MKKVLIASRVSLYPAEHGGAKTIRRIIDSLATAGCQTLVLVKEHPTTPERQRFGGQKAADLPRSTEAMRYLTVAGDSAALARALTEEAARFAPDAVILADDAIDPTPDLFKAGADTGKLVFLATTIHCLPFGPYSILRSEALSEPLKRARKILSPSQYVANYVERHLGHPSEVYLANVFGKAPYSQLGRHDNPYITMINPCQWKGSSIFIKLAKSRPDLSFAAVPTWGITEAILDDLKALPNMTLLNETPNIDEIFAKTRVLLAPSLCQEAFGLVSPEALLRGVPVIASDIAGLRESTLGAAPLIPVEGLPFDRPPVGTGPHDFVWHEPGNDVAPWCSALDELLGSKGEYERRSRWGREIAERFVAGLARQSISTMLG